MSKLKDFSTEREILTAYNPLLVQRLHDLHARLTGNTPALPWSVTPVHSPDQTVQSNASTVPQLPPHDVRQDVCRILSTLISSIYTKLLTPMQTSPVRGASPGPNTVAQTEAHISRLVCPNCKKRYCTVGAWRRHFLANLPHYIRCPYSGCYWTGDRFHSLEVHTENHPPKELVLEEYQIYDPEELLEWMADGTLTFVSAVDNAWSKVEERLTQQDMVGIEAEMRRSVWNGNRRKFCIAGWS